MCNDATNYVIHGLWYTKNVGNVSFFDIFNCSISESLISIYTIRVIP